MKAADIAKLSTPEHDRLSTIFYHSACADAAGEGYEIPAEEAFAMAMDKLKSLEQYLAAAVMALQDLMGDVSWSGPSREANIQMGLSEARETLAAIKERK